MKKLIIFAFLFFASYNCASTQKLENFRNKFEVLEPLVSVKSSQNENFDDACPPGKARVRNYCLDVDSNVFNEPEIQFRGLSLIKSRENFDFPCTDGKERISDGTCVPKCPSGQVRVGDYCSDIDRSAFASIFNKLETSFRRQFSIKNRENFDSACTTGKERISDGSCVPEFPPGQSRADDGTSLDEE